MNLCFAEDDFTRMLEEDSGTALWQALLSDGRVVTMDDGRPGEEIHSAWIRLGHYIRQTGLRINKLWLKFRCNRDENILAGCADGYFFSKSIMSEMNSDSPGLMFYLVGTLVGDALYVERWSVPSLILIDRECRSLDKVESQLIRNPVCETGNQTP